MDIKGKQQHKSYEAKIPYRLIICMFILRALIIPLLNFDYPDQYWQGPQIAYKIYNSLINNKSLGYETWQWTMQDPIRNPVYQFVLSLGYMGAHFVINVIQYIEENYGYQLGYYMFGFDVIMEFSPKIVQLFLAILGDVYVVKLAYFYFGKQKLSTFSILFVLFNWFYLSMLTRTYINSFECVLMSISFYYWQLQYSQNVAEIKMGNKIQLISRKEIISRITVLIAYVARPTSLIPWMIIWPFQLLSYIWQDFRTKNDNEKINVSKIQQIKQIFNCSDKILAIKLLAKNLIQIFLMLFSSFMIGSLYFSKPILTEWNFFYYNLVLKLSYLFGLHPWYFYLGISLPLILGGYLLLFFIGFVIGVIKSDSVFDKTEQTKREQYGNLCWMGILFLVITTLVSSHKEHRFLMIYMPFLLMIVFAGYIKLRQVLWDSLEKSKFKKLCFIVVILAILISNIWMLGTVALYPKGGFDILRKIRSQTNYRQKIQLSENKQHKQDSKISVMYLSDAHALPGFSIMLKDINLVLPDDSPLAQLSNRSQTELLATEPQKAYHTIIRKLTQKKGTNHNDIQIDFIILQQKYCKHLWVDSLQNQLKRIEQMRKGQTIPREQFQVEARCQFILKDFEWVMTSNNRNLWEQLIFGPDFLYLYVNKNFNKS